MSEELVAQQIVDGLFKDLRGRKLLKWLFAEEPETLGAIGYIDGPIDRETQEEIARAWRKIIGARLSRGMSDKPTDIFRPDRATIAAIEGNCQANAQAIVAIRDMMQRHVTNWPDVKRFGAAIALIDKTLTAALAPPRPKDRRDEK